MTVAARKKTNALKGILFMVVTCFIVTVSSTIIKTLGNTLNPFEVVMMRCAFTVLITLSFNYHVGPILFKSNQPKLMLIRSILTFVVVTGNFYAISNLPLVEVTSLQFSKPLFLIILAAIFLGEKIRLRRTSATILGFIGILVVLHPWDNATSEGFELAHARPARRLDNFDHPAPKKSRLQPRRADMLRRYDAVGQQIDDLMTGDVLAERVSRPQAEQG